MSKPIIVTDRETLESAVTDAVRRVMLGAVPAVLREADKPEWMSRDQVCETYGLTPRQLTYMRNNGRIEYTQHGRRILYNRESIEHWIEEGRVKARSGPAAKQDE
jgi:hypothetical protein